MSDPGWRAVGRRVDAERARRGWSLIGLARASGVGKSTIDKIVHGRRMSYDPATIAAIEAALGWQSGSIERIRNGLEPVPDLDPDLTAILEAWPKLTAQDRAMIRVIVTYSAMRKGGG